MYQQKALFRSDAKMPINVLCNLLIKEEELKDKKLLKFGEKNNLCVFVSWFLQKSSHFFSGELAEVVFTIHLF